MWLLFTDSCGGSLDGTHNIHQAANAAGSGHPCDRPPRAVARSPLPTARFHPCRMGRPGPSVFQKRFSSVQHWVGPTIKAIYAASVRVFLGSLRGLPSQWEGQLSGESIVGLPPLMKTNLLQKSCTLPYDFLSRASPCPKGSKACMVASINDQSIVCD